MPQTHPSQTRGAPDPGSPEVLLKLPDGQEIRARLLLRRRDATGAWWAAVAVSLWSRVDKATGAADVEPDDVELLVPMRLLHPLEEHRAAYAAVPTVDRTRACPWVIVWASPPPEQGERGMLHRAGCGRSQRWDAEAIDDRETLHALLAARGEGDRIGCCDLCRPQTAPEMIRLLYSARPAADPPVTLADTLRPADRRPRP